MELIEKELQMPVIKINYEDLEKELDKNLEAYSGLIVTEETLAGCKNAQKELASLRTKVDAYRKDKKKELSAPITAFEDQCKKLISKIEAVEAPIKEGIKVFDDLKRNEKRLVAEAIIEDVATNTGLNEKYKKQLTVIDKYLNLTATNKAVREDVETRAFALKVEQDREEERLNIIQSVIDSENQKNYVKLSIDQFQSMINYGMATSEIIEEVKKRAAKIHEAENRPQEAPVEPKAEEPKAPSPEPEKENAVIKKQYTATIRMVGTAEELRSVSGFIKAHGITYEVLEQKEVK